MSNMRQFTATPTVEELEAENERLRAVVDAATNLVRAQGKQIDEYWQVLDDAVDALAAADRIAELEARVEAAFIAGYKSGYHALSPKDLTAYKVWAALESKDEPL